MQIFDWLYFTHPSYLLFIPVLIILYFVRRQSEQENTALSDFIEPKLLGHLISSKAKKAMPSWIGLLTACLLVIGIAGISWEKHLTKSFVSPQQTIFILDQSLSMYATDIKPNRLTRLKQKVRDILDQLKGDDVAMTAYAGDSYVISPFSQDKSTLTHFLLALDPIIMPLYGSDLADAFKTSLKLISNPHNKTKIILFTDDISKADTSAVKGLISGYNLDIRIVGVGTEAGSTIPLPNGETIRTEQGPIKVNLPEQKLKDFAADINAQYYDSALSLNEISDIANSSNESINKPTEAQNNSLEWQENGYWFAFPFLIWLLYQFRTGVLFSLILCISLAHPPKIYASPLDWFATPDQKAQKLSDQGNWQEAQDLFKNKEWKAASKYALGNYDEAANILKDITNDTKSAEFFYNKGNSLALSGKLDESVPAYEKALSLRKNFPEAQENLKYVKDLLDKQKSQDKNQKNQNKKQNQNQNSDEKSSNDQSSQGDSQSQQNKSGQSSKDQDATKGKNQDQQETDKRNQQKETAKTDDSMQNQGQTKDSKNDLTQEDKIALNQWMRQIQDNPGGLLQRKLWYLHQEKRAENRNRQQDGLPLW